MKAMSMKAMSTQMVMNTTMLLSVFVQICLKCEVLVSSEPASAIGKGILSFVVSQKFSHQDSAGRFFSALNQGFALAGDFFYWRNL